MKTFVVIRAVLTRCRFLFVKIFFNSLFPITSNIYDLLVLVYNYGFLFGLLNWLDFLSQKFRIRHDTDKYIDIDSFDFVNESVFI